MATTTNYSWSTPDDTALVKDGALAIRTLGTAIDSTVFTNAGAAINKSIVDAKGDIIAATAADTVARLAVGANDTVLTADSSTATGLKWAAAGGIGANFTLLNSGGTSLSGSSTVTVSGISGADKILVLVDSATSGTAGIYFNLRLNTDTGNNYAQFGVFGVARTSYSVADVFKETSDFSQNVIRLGSTSTNNTSQLSAYTYLTGCNSSGLKVFQQSGTSSPSGGTNQEAWITGGYYNSASTISSISINAANNFTGGSVYVYTSA